jgi:flagellar motor switch protein FliM
LRAIKAIHVPFALNAASALSSVLRAQVECKLARVEQLSYGEFALGLESPACLHLLRAEPLAGNLALDVSFSILYPMIGRLLGGRVEPGPSKRRPLTDIELRVVRRITELCMDELRKAWEGVLPLGLAVAGVESDPRKMSLAPDEEMVVAIRFDLTIGGARGTTTLCIPARAIEPFADQLMMSGRPPHDQAPTASDIRAVPHQPAPPGKRCGSSRVELVVRLAQTRIAQDELVGLAVGDLITTETCLQNPLSVMIDGVAHFQAWPGAFQGRKAIRIERVLDTGQTTS